MLPLSVLRTAQGHPMLVELKNGETYNGHLVSCDPWMNLAFREVIMTSADGSRFFQIPECFIRGTSIKYIRIPEEIVDLMRDDFRQRKDVRGRPNSGGDNGRRFGGGHHTGPSDGGRRNYDSRSRGHK